MLLIPMVHGIWSLYNSFMKTCPHCQHENEDAVKICTGCGTEFRVEKSTNDEGKTKLGQTLVITTLCLWLGFVVLIFIVSQQPQVIFLPLYGLYPGDASSGEANYSPTSLHIWATFIGVVFIVLAIFAIWHRSTMAGIAFMVLFLVSTATSCVRISHALNGLH
jgi:hypothetical protein